MKNINKGLSLLEIIISLGLIATILATIIYISINVYNNETRLNQNVDYIINILNIAKQKSIIQEKNQQWGVILKNNATTADYIQLFYDQPLATSIERTFILDQNINFVNIPTNSTKIIIFEKLKGKTTSTNIEISFGQTKKNIMINTSGLIFATSSL